MFWSCMSLTKTVVNSIPEAGFSNFFLEISVEFKDNRIFSFSLERILR